MGRQTVPNRGPWRALGCRLPARHADMPANTGVLEARPGSSVGPTARTPSTESIRSGDTEKRKAANYETEQHPAITGGREGEA